MCVLSLSLSFPLPRPSLHPSLGRVALLPSSSNPPLPARAPRRISSSFETELAVVRGPNWIPVGEGVRRVSARFFLPSFLPLRFFDPPLPRRKEAREGVCFFGIREKIWREKGEERERAGPFLRRFPSLPIASWIPPANRWPTWAQPLRARRQPIAVSNVSTISNVSLVTRVSAEGEGDRRSKRTSPRSIAASRRRGSPILAPRFSFSRFDQQNLHLPIYVVSFLFMNLRSQCYCLSFNSVNSSRLILKIHKIG